VSCLFSWSVEFCIVLDLIGFWFGRFIRKGKVCFKEGKGRSQLLSLGHGKLLSGALSIPHPKPQPKNFSSVLSLFIPCHIRFSVYCPVTTLGLRHSIFVLRSEVRIPSIKSLSYDSVLPPHSRLSAILSRFLVGSSEILVQILEVGNLEIWKHYAITNFYFFLYRTLF
jgi:hypothetical protein